MKNCSYCGKQYADVVTVCPLDGTSLAVNPNENQKKIADLSAAKKPAFNARLIRPISFSGVYRIYVERNDLIFIQTEGGSKSVLAAFAPLLGPFGSLIHLALWLFSKQKTKARRQQIENDDPEDLLRESEKNFKLYLAEIRDAVIEPPSFISMSGKAGCLNLLVRHGEKIQFEFQTASEMKRAIQLLAPLLHSTLKVNVAWNGKKERFEKKK
ncbi:MAG: hypothetical protein ACREFE_17450 [Limisphaerales bacterium]